ncbi:MAG: glycosyltransferase family A protein [Vulcanimicrobiota bacterium]
MSTSRLAVLIPNYNHAHFLPGVLDSVLKQSKVPDEVWVSDDASTDNSLEVLQAYSARHPQVKVLRNATNAGIPENSFRPFHVTDCDYIYTLGTDEYLVDPDTFLKGSEILDRHPDLGLVCWDYAAILPDGTVFPARLQEVAGRLSPQQLCDRLRRKTFPLVTNNSLMRLKACLEPGVLCSEAGWNSDWVCCLTIGFRHGIYYLPGIHNHFPVRADGLAVQSRHKIRQSLGQILEVLKTPAYADVRHFYAESKAFANYLPEAFEVLVSRREYWKYLSWRMFASYCRIKILDTTPSLRALVNKLKRWSSH